MFSQFYGIPSKTANKRIQELLEIVGLADRMNTKSSDLSTGLRQKMNIVRGFMTDPDVLFMDEPTLGLDVGASREVRDFIRTWVNEGTTRTLLLTTHYMVEADELCDRVAIINKGKVLACDTPQNLKKNLHQEAIYHIEINPQNELNIEKFENLAGVRNATTSFMDSSIILDLILEEDDVLAAVVSTMTGENIYIKNLEKREPTLEDVFVELVGQSMEEIEMMDKDEVS